MPSPYADRAIADATRFGNALLKFISPNNVGTTGSHECGYYLPKSAWGLYTDHSPDKGVNYEDAVAITWQDGRVTDSRIKWYGVGTRSEYRLTRFGKDFPYLTAGNIGDLLVLVRSGATAFNAYVLDLEEDITEIQAALGVELTGTWGIYKAGAEIVEDIDDCLDRHFRAFSASQESFPSTTAFSGQALAAVKDCVREFVRESADKRLLRLMDAEYRLFKMVERRLCQNDVQRLFKSIDDFLATAATIMNRRKARAGRSLENHVEHILREAAIPFDVRPDIDGKPDIIIPGKVAYDDLRYPVEKLIMVGVKTTCKDRWRQVLNEAKRIKMKHLLTMQPGISGAQLNEMHEANVSLIVPEAFHKDYPSGSAMRLLTVEHFVTSVRQTLGT